MTALRTTLLAAGLLVLGVAQAAPPAPFVHDPVMIRQGGTFYLFGTGQGRRAQLEGYEILARGADRIPQVAARHRLYQHAMIDPVEFRRAAIERLVGRNADGRGDPAAQ